MHLTYDLINQADWFDNFWFDHQSTLYLWHLLDVLSNAILAKIWEMTRNLCAHPAWLPDATISKCCYFSYMVFIYNLKILLSLHYFFTPLFQTFTNLLIGIFGVSNPTFFFYYFLEILRKYVSIIVNIISNNTVLQCYLLWIFISVRRILQLIVCMGCQSPTPTL